MLNLLRKIVSASATYPRISNAKRDWITLFDSFCDHTRPFLTFWNNRGDGQFLAVLHALTRLRYVFTSCTGHEIAFPRKWDVRAQIDESCACVEPSRECVTITIVYKRGIWHLHAWSRIVNVWPSPPYTYVAFDTRLIFLTHIETNIHMNITDFHLFSLY